MIRRNPTLISMSDLDVQDVRNMVTKERLMKRLADPNKISKDDAEEAKRLGLELGVYFMILVRVDILSLLISWKKSRVSSE